MSLKSICVFCGASKAVSTIYTDAARELGYIIADAGIELIYGGGSYGLMGEISDAVIEKGGRAIGFMPEDLLQFEGPNNKITELTMVSNMHERKKNMFKQAGAFVTLPGGFGTFDELFEVITWKKLHFHSKSIVIVDIDGYWGHLKLMLDRMIKERFAGPEVNNLYIFVNSVEEVLPAIMSQENYRDAEE